MIEELENINAIKVGGQKEVFSANHVAHGSVVFKKIFPKSDSFERTKREIRAVSLFNQDLKVPRILAHNCEEDTPDFIWFVEEHIGGLNLRDTIKSGRTFNINHVVKFIDTMLTLAIHSENHQLVHRDIKPEILWLTQRMNFGF